MRLWLTDFLSRAWPHLLLFVPAHRALTCPAACASGPSACSSVASSGSCCSRGSWPSSELSTAGVVGARRQAGSLCPRPPAGSASCCSRRPAAACRARSRAANLLCCPCAWMCGLVGSHDLSDCWLLLTVLVVESTPTGKHSRVSSVAGRQPGRQGFTKCYPRRHGTSSAHLLHAVQAPFQRAWRAAADGHCVLGAARSPAAQPAVGWLSCCS